MHAQCALSERNERAQPQTAWPPKQQHEETKRRQRGVVRVEHTATTKTKTILIVVI